MNELKANPLRAAWKDGRAAISGWCYMPSPVAAEAMAMLDWDLLTIDMQHGLVGYQDVVAMLPAIEAAGAGAMVRVPWNDPGTVMKVLDAGAIGVICPMINNREECTRFVEACRYAPDGYRSFGPLRVSRYYHHIGAVMAAPDGGPVTLAMIETEEGLRNIDEIAATPGLDGLYLGPSDLTLSMGQGQPGLDRTDSFVMEAHRTVLEACRRHGIRAGLNVNAAAYAARMIEFGYDLICLHSDLGLMRAAGEALLTEVRSLARRREAAPAA
jgi:4-hydroxy-2-oxoheptanedioate aldolase